MLYLNETNQAADTETMSFLLTVSSKFIKFSVHQPMRMLCQYKVLPTVRNMKSLGTGTR